MQQNSLFTEIVAVFQKKNARLALAPDYEVVSAFFSFKSNPVVWYWIVNPFLFLLFMAV